MTHLARHGLWPRERETMRIGSEKTWTTNLCGGRAILRARNQLSRCASRASSSTSRKGEGAGRESASWSLFERSRSLSHRCAPVCPRRRALCQRVCVCSDLQALAMSHFGGSRDSRRRQRICLSPGRHWSARAAQTTSRGPSASKKLLHRCSRAFRQSTPKPRMPPHVRSPQLTPMRQMSSSCWTASVHGWRRRSWGKALLTEPGWGLGHMMASQGMDVCVSSSRQ